jgi:hypothetical protein
MLSGNDFEPYADVDAIRTWQELVGNIAGRVGLGTHLLTGSPKQSSHAGNYRYTVLNSE